MYKNHKNAHIYVKCDLFFFSDKNRDEKSNEGAPISHIDTNTEKKGSKYTFQRIDLILNYHVQRQIDNIL